MKALNANPASGKVVYLPELCYSASLISKSNMSEQHGRYP